MARALRSIRKIVFGDSIGLGYALAVGAPCDCVEGREPREVLAAIRHACTQDALTGWDVVVSTGMSNNRMGGSYVEEQLRVLLDSGASRIVLLGVGPGDPPKLDFAGINDWLRGLVERSWTYRVFFAGPLELPAVGTRMNVDPRGVHPYDYLDVAAQVDAVLG